MEAQNGLHHRLPARVCIPRIVIFSYQNTNSIRSERMGKDGAEKMGWTMVAGKSGAYQTAIPHDWIRGNYHERLVHGVNRLKRHPIVYLSTYFIVFYMQEAGQGRASNGTYGGSIPTTYVQGETREHSEETRAKVLEHWRPLRQNPAIPNLSPNWRNRSLS